MKLKNFNWKIYILLNSSTNQNLICSSIYLSNQTIFSIIFQPDPFDIQPLDVQMFLDFMQQVSRHAVYVRPGFALKILK